VIFDEIGRADGPGSLQKLAGNSAVGLDMAKYRMADGRFAKLPCHRDVLRVIEMLAQEEDDLPFQKGFADFLQLLGRLYILRGRRRSRSVWQK